MINNILTGKWALVTGGSSGLGVDFARALAGRGMNLVLVARREEKLRQVQEEISRDFPVEVRVLPFDLARDRAAESLYQRIQQLGIEVDILINNAGFGLYGDFLKEDWENEQDMIRLNVQTLVGLTKLFGREMVERGAGRILLVASNAAYQPSPGYAVYGGTKTFVLSFGEAVNYELKDSPVNVTVISPGPTQTEFHDVSGQGRDNLYIKMVTMESERVAEIGVKAMLRGKPSVVPGFVNKIGAWFGQRIPRRWATALAAWMMGV